MDSTKRPTLHQGIKLDGVPATAPMGGVGEATIQMRYSVLLLFMLQSFASPIQAAT